jgi:protease-4
MAKKRDIVIAVVIGGSFLIALVFIGLVFVGMMTETEGFVGFGDNVGVVEVFGTIDEPSGRPIIEQLDNWAENSSIKAIIVHINSGGGGVAISQEIYDAVLRARAEKPVVACMASAAASGAYYIACAADRIIANPGTLTGSIGVIMQFYTYGELMEKVGIDVQMVKSGELKDVGSIDRNMTKKEELMLKSVIMDTYEQFVEVVAEGRDMDREEVYPLADGSLFTGSQAYNLGLVDTLGGFAEAVDLAADLAGIAGEPSIVKPRRRERAGLFDLFGSLIGDFSSEIEKGNGGPQLLYLYQ